MDTYNAAPAHDVYGVDANRCIDLSAARKLEWLVTNGRGGFATATVGQMLTRRYHGLLVAAVEPPVERFVLLAKLEATVRSDGLTYELGTNDYVEAVHPQGYRLLESFTSQPYPTWRWRAGEALIEQTLCMAPGEDSTFIRYRLLEGTPVALLVRPLCTGRHCHSLTHYQDMGPPTVDQTEDSIALHWSGNRPGLRLSHNGSFRSRPDWYYQFVLTAEAERGYDFTQDLFVPGVISAALKSGDKHGLVFVATRQDRSWNDWRTVFSQAAGRGRASPINVGDPLLEPLLRAADDFVVGRGESGRTIIAGYPWFGDWGRDTFISLAGLCMVPGRLAEARKIIETFSHYVDGGMIPNRFPDFGEPPAYNTSDASLWYIQALDRYLAYSGDWRFVAEAIFPAVVEIIEAHERGTRHGIRVDADGLLAQGEPGLALTWMDARLPDRAVTGRIGKAVEINALWYNALQVAASYADRLGDGGRAAHWRQAASKAKASFNRRFWNEAASCLYDVVDADGEAGKVDASIRPNQLLAVSLIHPVLDESRWQDVIKTCERELWTPLGLRSLSPGDPAYRGRYAGDTAARDSAYHQGTVWPWLLGPFVTAYVRAHGDTPKARSAARNYLDGLLSHLREAGIGSVSEVADGDAPHTPGGCPWQAWSVAEPLRALCEDILKTHPPLREPQSTASRPASQIAAAPSAGV